MHRNDMLAAIAREGKIGPYAAIRVLEHYLRPDLRAVKITAHDGYVLTHGAFLDYAVIRRALADAR